MRKHCWPPPISRWAVWVIVGRRGTSLFEKLLLGSVSERVIRFAHCPVMVIK